MNVDQSKLDFIESRLDIISRELKSLRNDDLGEAELRSFLNITRRLSERAQSAFLGWMISGVIVLLIVICVPLVAYDHRETIFDLLHNVESINPKLSDQPVAVTALAAAGRLVLISLPVGFLVWAMKIIVAYNQRCLSIRDDADMRIVLLKTYLFLAERKLCTDADRVYILSLLMGRPFEGPVDLSAPMEWINFGKNLADKDG